MPSWIASVVGQWQADRTCHPMMPRRQQSQLLEKHNSNVQKPQQFVHFQEHRRRDTVCLSSSGEVPVSESHQPRYRMNLLAFGQCGMPLFSRARVHADLGYLPTVRYSKTSLSGHALLLVSASPSLSRNYNGDRSDVCGPRLLPTIKLNTSHYHDNRKRGHFSTCLGGAFPAANSNQHSPR